MHIDGKETSMIISDMMTAEQKTELGCDRPEADCVPKRLHVNAETPRSAKHDDTPDQFTCLSIKDGARAEVQEHDDQQTLRLFAPDGVLMFEYDTVSKRGRAYAPDGNLEVSSVAGEIDFMAAERMRFVSKRIEIETDRMVTSANNVINRISNLYQEVEGITQLITGRLRTLVKGTWQNKCRRVYLKAEEDVKINGSHIHLG